MNRLRAITIGGAVLAALVLGLFAYLLADAHSDDKEEERKRFQDVAQVSGAVTNGIFQAAFQSTQMQAAEDFSAQVEQQALVEFAQQGQSQYVAVLDDRGRRLGATSGTPEQPGPAVETALETGQPRLSDVMGTGRDATIEFAIPYETASGRRVLVQGSPTGPFADFLAASLGELPTFADAETAMVDSKGIVLGGANLSTPVGETLDDTDLLDALKSEEFGTYAGDRYFAASGIANTPFKIVLNTSEDDLYESVAGQAVSWIIFAAFALALLAGLLALRRASLAANELQRRELNERHAVEINDNIIQGLALAKYKLQAGQGKESADQVSETLREAQRLVSNLLGDAEVQAGQLRREVAAETTRPEPPPPEAQP